MNHTPEEIIEQCKLRWQVSFDDDPTQFDYGELGHMFEAADTILEEFKLDKDGD